MVKAQVLQRLCASMGTCMLMSALGSTWHEPQSCATRRMTLLTSSHRQECEEKVSARFSWWHTHGLDQMIFKSAPSFEMHMSIQIKNDKPCCSCPGPEYLRMPYMCLEGTFWKWSPDPTALHIYDPGKVIFR